MVDQFEATGGKFAGYRRSDAKGILLKETSWETKLAGVSLLQQPSAVIKYLLKLLLGGKEHGEFVCGFDSWHGSRFDKVVEH
ncbi:MAG: hypothetical protein EBS61_07050 [Betaproteobacteria bacterium]|jgi:hypothetical protein|nr:hypothetical protein [Betaproteobacteria bacterium]